MIELLKTLLTIFVTLLFLNVLFFGGIGIGQIYHEKRIKKAHKVLQKRFGDITKDYNKSE